MGQVEHMAKVDVDGEHYKRALAMLAGIRDALRLQPYASHAEVLGAIQALRGGRTDGQSDLYLCPVCDAVIEENAGVDPVCPNGPHVNVACPRHGERTVDLNEVGANVDDVTMCPDCRVVGPDGKPLGWQDGRPTEYVDLSAMYRTGTLAADRLVAETQRLAAADNPSLHHLEDYAAGEVVPLDTAAILVAARALAIWDGDGHIYDEDEDTREGFTGRANLAVGIYLDRTADGLTMAGKLPDLHDAVARARQLARDHRAMGSDVKADALEKVLAELAALRVRIDAARKLHREGIDSARGELIGDGECVECDQPWPCLTSKRLTLPR